MDNNQYYGRNPYSNYQRSFTPRSAFSGIHTNVFAPEFVGKPVDKYAELLKTSDARDQQLVNSFDAIDLALSSMKFRKDDIPKWTEAKNKFKESLDSISDVKDHTELQALLRKTTKDLLHNQSLVASQEAYGKEKKYKDVIQGMVGKNGFTQGMAKKAFQLSTEHSSPISEDKDGFISGGFTPYIPADYVDVQGLISKFGSTFKADAYRNMGVKLNEDGTFGGNERYLVTHTDGNTYVNPKPLEDAMIQVIKARPGVLEYMRDKYRLQNIPEDQIDDYVNNEIKQYVKPFVSAYSYNNNIDATSVTKNPYYNMNNSVTTDDNGGVYIDDPGFKTANNEQLTSSLNTVLDVRKSSKGEMTFAEHGPLGWLNEYIDPGITTNYKFMKFLRGSINVEDMAGSGRLQKYKNLSLDIKNKLNVVAKSTNILSKYGVNNIDELPDDGINELKSNIEKVSNVGAYSRLNISKDAQTTAADLIFASNTGKHSTPSVKITENALPLLGTRYVYNDEYGVIRTDSDKFKEYLSDNNGALATAGGLYNVENTYSLFTGNHAFSKAAALKIGNDDWVVGLTGDSDIQDILNNIMSNTFVTKIPRSTSDLGYDGYIIYDDANKIYHYYDNHESIKNNDYTFSNLRGLLGVFDYVDADLKENTDKK